MRPDLGRLLQVDAGAGAVVAAHSNGRAGNARATLVLGQGFRRERRQARVPRAHDAAHVACRIGFDQRLGQRRRLDEEEPVPVRPREVEGRALVHAERRRDVEQHQPLDCARMIGRQPVRGPRAAVVREHAEVLEALLAHDGECVERHLALRIGRAAFARIGAPRIAVAAQVHQHDREMLRKARRDEVPHRMRLRVTVQQEQGLAAARAPASEAHTAAQHLEPLETLERLLHEADSGIAGSRAASNNAAIDYFPIGNN